MTVVQAPVLAAGTWGTQRLLFAMRDAGRLPNLSALLGTLVLVAGQFVVEQLSGNSTTLSVVVEFAGGIVFILLLLKGALK